MNIKTIALTLQPYIANLGDLCDASEAVLGLFPSVDAPTPSFTIYDKRTNGDYPYTRHLALSHDAIVGLALANPNVIQHMREGKRINAIKEIRRISNCSLLEAKNASEDDRLQKFFGF